MQQFGEPKPGLLYRPRPAAFGIAERDGRIAVVHIRPDDGGDWIDLPGGGVDAGESEPQALIRELGEETGLVVAAGAEILRFSQYFLRRDGEPVNNEGGIYHVAVTGEAADLQTEPDHELLWISPADAVEHLRHDSHAYAVAMWWRHR